MSRNQKPADRSYAGVIALTCAFAAALPVSATEPTQTPMTFIVLVDVSGSMDDALPSPIQPILSDKTKIANVRRKVDRLSKDLPEETRVIVIVFDHASRTLCDVKLRDAGSRKQLQQAVDGIKSSGGTTFLWRAADDALALARKLATENPENRVRMLLLSDGGDEEHAPGLDHNSLVKKYRDLLQEVVTLDWVTIGWDLAADVKRVLQEQHVNVVRVDEAVNLVPLSADFELSASTICVGEEVGLLDHSYGIGIVLRAADFGDGTPYSKGDVLRHRYERQGTFTIRYLVRSETGQEDRVSKDIKVISPQAPIAKIKTAEAAVRLGQPVVLLDVSEGEVVDRRWLLPGGEVKSGTEIKHQFVNAGLHEIGLVVTDKIGQRSEAKTKVLVQKPPAPKAKIELSVRSAKPGDTVTAMRTTQDGTRHLWLLPDGSESSRRNATFVVPETYGDLGIGLKVWDEFGQEASDEVTLNVLRPEQPVAELFAPRRAKPGEMVSLVDQSKGEIHSSKLFVNGREIEHERVVSFKVPVSGEVSVIQEVEGPGGKAKFEHVIKIDEFPPPRAGFTIGTTRAALGDSVLITSTATGPIDSMVFHVDSLELPITIDMSSGTNSPTFELPCSSLGIGEIRQVVTGPGGVNEVAKTFEVVPKAVQPTALIMPNRLTGRGPTEVTFDNQSTGSVDRTVYDFGDGSPTENVEFDGDVYHEFMPGTWVVKATVIGPEGTSPRTWQETIEIAAPMDKRLVQALWLTPLGLCAIGCCVWLVSRRTEERFVRSLDMLNGSVVMSPVHNIYESKTFSFDGGHTEEERQWDESTSVLVSVAEGEPGADRVCITLKRDGLPDEPAMVAGSGESLTLGDFTIVYTA